MPVGGRHQYFLDEPLDVPAAFHEIGSQPIQQFGVGGQIALHPEIPCRFYDAPAKYFLPYQVHKNTGGQGVVGRGGPAGQPQPVFFVPVWKFQDGFGGRGLHRPGFGIIYPPVEDVGGPFFIGIQLAHYRDAKLLGVGIIDKGQNFLDVFLAEFQNRGLGGLGLAHVPFKALFAGIVEKGKYLIVFLLRNGVVFVVVALGTFHGHPQYSLAKGVGLVQYILDPVFLVDNAAFLGVFVVAVEGCREHLFLGGVW